MQLVSFIDYGLCALIYMASLPKGHMASISEVTEVYGISRNHMVKIINQLNHISYAIATRRKNRDTHLGKPVGQTHVGDVMRDLEPLLLANYNSELCHTIPAYCPKQALVEAVQSFLRELDNHTSTDLVEKN